MRVYLIAAGKKTPPDAPSSLTATAVSASRIDLAWTNNATSYDFLVVERSEDNVNYFAVQTLSQGVSSWSDTGLSASTQYYYRVRAYKGVLNSAYSNTADATTSALAVERIIEIDTRNTESGSSANNQFRLVVNVGSNYNVDWGDGTSQTGVTAFTTTKTYATAGIYDIKITGVCVQQVNSLAANDRRKYVKIKQWGSGVTTTTYSDAFNGCALLTVTATDAPNMTGVTNLTSMFRGCGSIGSPNFSGWNVSGITTFASMFTQSNFNGNITTWNTASATNMSSMFQTNSAFNQNIGSWNVGNVTNFSSMFQNASAFRTNLNSWNVSNATNMSSMFQGIQLYNESLSSWDVSKVTSFVSMFNDARAFNQNISSWNTSQATNMSSMFSNARAFNQPIGSWNVGNVIEMTNMFNAALAFNQNINSWDVSKVVSFASMFQSCSVFNQPLNSWNTSSALNMNAMFSACSSFNQNIGSWNVSNATNLSNMFSGASSLNQNLSSWNVGKVTSFANMFSGATAMANNSSIASWSIGSALTGTASITFDGFLNSVNYTQDLSSWNMARVFNITAMLSGGRSNFNYGVWNIRFVNSATFFMSGATTATLSATNLANMYIGWSTLPLRPITLSFGTAKYDASGTSARAILTATRAVNVTGAIDANANGTYTWNGTRYQNANGWHFLYFSDQWNLINPSSNVRATTTGSIPFQNSNNPMSGIGWTGAESGIAFTLVGAGWTITDGGQL